MDIARALSPFIPEGSLSDAQLSQVSAYLDLLLKWNAKINLTSVRTPDEILTRHFGESLFLAHNLARLYPGIVIPSEGAPKRSAPQPTDLGSENEQLSKSANQQMLIDLGSGAGFPGLPLKIYASNLSVTLIESNQKKATFLREVIRAIRLTDINVFASRAEDYLCQLGLEEGSRNQERSVIPSENESGNESKKPLNERMSKSANEQMVVTLRAVEHFDRILPLAAQILAAHMNCHPEQSEAESRDLGFAVRPSKEQPGPPSRPGSARGGIKGSKSANEQITLALLIGSSQLPNAHRLLPHFTWDGPIPVPFSSSRILLLGHPLRKTGSQESEASS